MILQLVQHNVRPDCSLPQAVADKDRGGAAAGSRPADDPAVSLSQFANIAWHRNLREKPAGVSLVTRSDQTVES